MSEPRHETAAERIQVTGTGNLPDFTQGCAPVLPNAGHPEPSSALAPHSRDAGGRFVPGNAAARQAGVRAFEERGETSLPSELRDELAAFRAGVEADQGGITELTTIRAGYVGRLTEVETIVRLLIEDLRSRLINPSTH